MTCDIIHDFSWHGTLNFLCHAIIIYDAYVSVCYGMLCTLSAAAVQGHMKASSSQKHKQGNGIQQDLHGIGSIVVLS